MKATQIQYKTKNQLFNDFISLVKAAFKSFSIEGWEVRQLRQTFKINHLKPIVFISVISGHQLGQQYYLKTKIDNQITREAHNKQEVTIRFSATRLELPNDTLETYNGTDILKVIRAYMQSPEGIKFLASLGFAQYKAQNINEMNFTNDSDDFQFLPHFECTFLYTDIWGTTIPEITKVKEKGIYHI